MSKKLVARKNRVFFRVEIFTEPDNEQWHAYCPALKGLHVGGDSEKEAIKNALYGASLFIQSMIKHREPIPLEARILVEPEPGQARAYPRQHSEQVAVYA